MLYRLLPMLLLAAFLITGCEKKRVADPPTARAELTTRLYDALQDKRYEEALAIIDKLLASDPDDVDLLEMQIRVTANMHTVQIQQAVDDGDLDKALQLLREARKKHPAIRQFLDMEEEITALTELRDAAGTLANAKTIPELRKALETIRLMDISGQYPQAVALQKDIAKRQQDLKNMIAAEAKAKAEAEARARAAAEAKAKAEAEAKARAEAEARAAAEAQAKAAAEAKAKAEAEAKAKAKAKAKAEAQAGTATDKPQQNVPKLIQPDPNVFVGPQIPQKP